MINRSFEGRVQALKEMVEGIGREFKKSSDDWMGVMVMERRDRSAIMPLAFGSEEEKTILATEAMPYAIRMFKPEFVGQVQSAWQLKSEDVDDVSVLDVRPSQHPKRVEVVILMGMTVDQVQFWAAEIIRSRRKPPTLSKWELWPTDAFHTGQFFEPIREALLEIAEEEE